MSRPSWKLTLSFGVCLSTASPETRASRVYEVWTSRWGSARLTVDAEVEARQRQRWLAGEQRAGRVRVQYQKEKQRHWHLAVTPRAEALTHCPVLIS